MRKFNAMMMIFFSFLTFRCRWNWFTFAFGFLWLCMIPTFYHVQHFSTGGWVWYFNKEECRTYIIFYGEYHVVSWRRRRSRFCNNFQNNQEPSTRNHIFQFGILLYLCARCVSTEERKKKYSAPMWINICRFSIKIIFSMKLMLASLFISGT